MTADSSVLGMLHLPNINMYILCYLLLCGYLTSAFGTEKVAVGGCVDGGLDCVATCSLNCRSGCDVTGKCLGGCTAGWTGDQCDEVCSDYRFGVNCLNSCGHCLDDAVCNVSTGECPGECVPGFTGARCNQPCDPYFYGDGCQYVCRNCRNNKPCNMVTGACINGCDLGYKGDRCDQMCENSTYGIDCMNQCGHCEGNQSCNHASGLCPAGCEPGWTGDKCDSQCTPGWFGQHCDYHCGHCRYETCDHVTGECRSGCTAGYSGRQCKIPCPADLFGEDCIYQCGNCEAAMCDAASGVCVKGCMPGWRGITCHQECKDSFHGKSCAIGCGLCKGGHPCNKTTGVCEGGCEAGWDGKYCTQRTVEETEYPPMEPEDNELKKQSTVSLLVVVIVLLFMALSSTVIYFLCIRPRRMDITSRLQRLSSVRSDQDAEPHLYEQVQGGQWEISKANLVLTTEKLGTGQFGQVRKGYIKNVRNHNIPVAVKSLKVSSCEKDKTDFMNELLILKKVGTHPNVVCLIGSCHIEGTLYVAMEYCALGDLRTHLRNSRKRKQQKLYNNVQSFAPMAYSSLLKFALDVACGMAHLADRQIIHRDLAARNVLLGENYVAKVADFGLSKNDDTYVKTSRSKVPVRWLALESIFSNTYTTQSDVWSFGVLLWEIVTYGGTPYHGMDTQQFCDLLKQGYRLTRPRHCDMALYAMMLQCWQEEPSSRPDFLDLQCRLQSMVDDTQIYINIDEELGYTNMDGDD